MCHQPPRTDVCITFMSSLMGGRFNVKGRLPVKITGNQIKQGILKPVEIDSFILGGTIRLLREFERNMMAHRANIAARHYIPPEWTVSVPAFSCFVFP